MSKIKVIIFDFFEVIHSDAYLNWLQDKGLKREGVYSDIPNKLDSGQISLHEFYNALAEESSEPVADIKGYIEGSGSINRRMVELIEALHGPYKTALLSNAHAHFLRPILKAYDLERLFDDIVISSEVGHIKPSREIFHHIMDILQVTPSDCVFIDDNEHNIAAAQKLGITGIHFDGNITTLQRNLTSRDILTQADQK